MISVVADMFALGSYLSEGLVTARGGDVADDVAEMGGPYGN